MEKKTKKSILIGISALVLVTLTLLGLTYAYYRTRIIGNQSTDPSISVTTKKLELVYADGSGVLAPTGLLEPSDTQVGEKTFTVTNTGDETITDYKVYLENVQNPLTEGGLAYTLECTQYVNYGEADQAESGTCNEIVTETEFPHLMTAIAINTIGAGITHEYTITLWYKDTGLDQSNDMGKTISAKVNIYDGTTKFLSTEILSNVSSNANGTQLFTSGPTQIASETSSSNWDSATTLTELSFVNGSVIYYSANKPEGQCLADITNKIPASTNCVDSVQVLDQDYTNLCTEFDNGKTIMYIWDNWTQKVYNVVGCTDANKLLIKAEATFQTTEDDYGTSYYYRGAVGDNYVNFAGMCWRIMRIQGDGSIKLILEDQAAECDSTDYTGNWSLGKASYGSIAFTSGGYVANYLNPVPTDYSGAQMVTLLKNFQTTSNLKDYTTYLKAGDWCYNDNAYPKDNNTNLLINNLTYTLSPNYAPLHVITSSTTDTTGTSYYYSGKYDMIYDSYIRLSGSNEYNPTFKCPLNKTGESNMMTVFADDTPMYVSTITADEAVYAGAKWGAHNLNYYLINDYFKGLGSYKMWTLSLSRTSSAGHDRPVRISESGYLFDSNVYDLNHVRPAIILKTGTTLNDGNGTQSNPYVVGS